MVSFISLKKSFFAVKSTVSSHWPIDKLLINLRFTNDLSLKEKIHKLQELVLILWFIQSHMFKIYPINKSNIQSHVAVGDKTKYMSCIIPHVVLNVYFEMYFT